MASRVSRIFLSFTFGDFQVEREVLRARVWTKLEHYCQIVDARTKLPILRDYDYPAHFAATCSTTGQICYFTLGS
jgi:hypothetical protein